MVTGSASDYSIYLDEKNKFHFMPHDANETFQAPMGPGWEAPEWAAAVVVEAAVAVRVVQVVALRRTWRWYPGGGPPGGGFGGPPGGPPGMMGGVGRGIELDPLTGMQDTSKPLRGKLLAVPKYRERYLQMVKIIAKEQLDWAKLGPKVESYGKVIKPFIEADTRS